MKEPIVTSPDNLSPVDAPPGLPALAAALSAGLGQDLTAAAIHPLQDAAHKAEVADATLKYRVSLPGEAPGFLLVSGAGNPDMMGRAVRNIALCRAQLSAAVAAPVLPPLTDGVVAGRHFALWSARPDFLAGGRVLRVIRRRQYTGRICDWLVALAAETRKKANTETVSGDLGTIAGDAGLPDAIRGTAHQALDRLRAGTWVPEHCFQHGDFWSGNVLRPLRGEAVPFHVIDWAGLSAEGYPFIDMARMLMSLRSPARVATRHVAALQEVMACSREDALAYVLAALGHTGQRLEHFPPDRYRALVGQVCGFMKAL